MPVEYAPMEMPLLTLVTDFGTADQYVGTMKGVILGIAPEARLVDLTHDIAPQSVSQAAYVLYAAYQFFPARTVHLVVVDPGVGGDRRAVALQTAAGTFVGPDNGVFSYVMARESEWRMVELSDPQYRLSTVSHTFHGRDIFAPAAAYLASGVPLEELGRQVGDPVWISLPAMEQRGRTIRGEIMAIDRFGNLVTSIGKLRWENGTSLSICPAFPDSSTVKAKMLCALDVEISVGGRTFGRISHTYADVEPGEMLVLVGSGGHLEVAVREGSAADRLGLELGDSIEIVV